MKALLIGYGSIGKRHERILLSLGWDVDLVTKQQIPGKKTVPDLTGIADLASYDYFLICSETSLHWQQLEFLNSRLAGKDIFVEKPVGVRPEPELPARNRVWVGYNMRWQPVLQRLKTELAGQKPVMAVAYVGQYLPTWHPWADYRHSYSASKSKGGGVALDLSHELDYLQWLLGPLKRTESVKAKVSDLDIDTEDVFLFLGTSASGAAVSCTMDYISKTTKRFLLLHTLAKTYYVDFIAETLQIGTLGGDPELVHLKAEDSDESFRRMHVAILQDRGASVCTLQEAARVLSLVEGEIHASR